MTIFAKLFETATTAAQKPPSRKQEDVIGSEIRDGKTYIAPIDNDLSGKDAAATSQHQTKEKRNNKKKRKQQNQGQGEKGNKDPTASENDDNKGKRRRGRNSSPPKRWRRPSPEALALSDKLRVLSRQKHLRQALDLYWSAENERVRDDHHACIVVDCCARCGDLDEAEKVFEERCQKVVEKKRHQHHHTEDLGDVPVEMTTALMKAYSHAGSMRTALTLFQTMCGKIPTGPQRRTLAPPNVRTLNTLLRGCLWTAATLDTTNDDPMQVTGGVVTSEEAWKLYEDTRQASSSSTTSTDMTPPDESSYEASLGLLCQALRTHEAEGRLQEFQALHGIRIKGKAGIRGGNQASLETLAVSYLHLAQAQALLGQHEKVWLDCQRCLHAMQASKALLENDSEEASASSSTTPKKFKKNHQQVSHGGKQAYRNKADAGDERKEEDTRRLASNTAYRHHRLSEIEEKAKMLVAWRGDVQSATANTSKLTTEVTKQMDARLLYFSGGGTTGLSAGTPSLEKTKQKQKKLASFALLVPSWYSFGLGQLEGSDANLNVAQLHTLNGSRKGDPVHKDGLIKTSRIFVNDKHPLDVEIGSGFGDWIVRQAVAFPERNHIAVEMRADRVHQIFTRGVLARSKPLSNLCTVGSDAEGFLADHMPSNSVSTMFCNHPEPPTQVFGEDRADIDKIIRDGGNASAHMLSASTLRAAAQCLRSPSAKDEQGGRMIIVTDNRWYARVICATLVHVIRSKEGGVVLRSATPSEMRRNNFYVSESLPNDVSLYEGKPNASIGHAQTDHIKQDQGSSYFDRLWKTGTNKHAERTARFVIVVYRSK